MRDEIRLLIVDDSRMMRAAVAELCENNARIVVVGEAASGEEALRAIERLDPDVVTLDVNMPGMDGLSVLKRTMIFKPRPIVMLSSLTQEGATVTFDALRYGAVDFIAKPNNIDFANLHRQFESLATIVERAAEVETQAIKYIRTEPTDAAPHQALGGAPAAPCEKVVAIGGAEGAYAGLMKIVPALPAAPAVAYLVVLYTDSQYVDGFARYLEKYSRVRVKRAVHDELLESGVVYISSGEDYKTLQSRPDGLALHVSRAPFDTRRGSIDMLMFSVADVLGPNSVGVILSGADGDGAEGLEEIMRVGGTAVVQDPATCFCKDMARAALERNTLPGVVADVDIAAAIETALH